MQTQKAVPGRSGGNGAGVAAIPLDLSLPRASFVSEAEFRREREAVLFTGWFCVGRAEILAGPGDYLTADVAGESVVVVRGDDGELRGFYNVCRHRGSRLVPPEHGEPAAGQSGVAARTGHPVDVATWGGFLFARLEPGAGPELAEALGEIDGRLAAFPLADLRAGARLSYEVAANWKVVLENYNECYHCGPVHPELCELIPDFARDGGDVSWEAGVPHRDGAYTFTATGTTRRLPFPGLSETERTRHFGELMLPNLMISLSADHVAAFTVWPRAAGRTTVVCDFLFHPDEMARPDFDPSDAVSFWDLVNRQDWLICERVQDGMTSRRFTAGYLAPMEQPSADVGRYVAARLGNFTERPLEANSS